MLVVLIIPDLIFNGYFGFTADLVMLGVGFHHAGVDVADRKMVEKAFTQGDLPVLCED